MDVQHKEELKKYLNESDLKMLQLEIELIDNIIAGYIEWRAMVEMEICKRMMEGKDEG